METSTTNSNDRKPLVLSVDDEENIARAIKRTLRRANVEVLTASSGAEGLKLLEAHEFDLILSDMRMPEMTGAQFLAAAAKQQPDTKRVLLTGYSDIQSTIEAINEGGVSTYLTKPWDDDKLISVVEDAVKVKNLEQKNSSLEKLKSELEAALTKLSDSHRTVIALLGNAIGMRDKVGLEFDEHKIQLAQLMGKELGMSGPQLEDLHAAVTLHRIGRMSIPEDLLRKPFLSMNDDEKAMFTQHPIYADAVLMGLPELQNAALIIRHQNEWFDGSGFPDGLSNQDVPLGSAITAAVREFFDMQAGLYEPENMSPSEARQTIDGLKGKRFSPELIEAFGSCVEQLAIAQVEEEEVELSDLKPTMILTRDLKTEGGVLLLSKDQELTLELIQKITRVFKSASPGPIHIRR